MIGIFQQRSANEDFKRCNYFKWCNEDNVDKKDAIIGRQSKKITDMEKTLIDYEKWVNFLIRMIFVTSQSDITDLNTKIKN